MATQPTSSQNSSADTTKSSCCSGASPAASAPANPPANSDYPHVSPADLPENTTSVTRGTWKGGSASIDYKATAGTLRIDTPKVKPASSIFYVAFEAVNDKGETDPNRPVTFVFNGGPGASSSFLMMGSFGPQRVKLPDVDPGHGAPYELEENNEFCLLPVTDIIFIDAPGTGFSQIADGAQKELWSVDGDSAGFSQFICRWCSINGRWQSPKYLIGESYGTTRGSLLTLQMQNDGVALTGAALLSNIWDYAPIFDISDQLYIGYFPTFAMTAQYHGRAGKGKSPEQWAQEAREFAEIYRRVLARGQKVSDSVLEATAKKYSEMTGLMEEYVKESNLRIPDTRFRKELLHDEQKIVGRYDGRVAGYDLDPTAASETFIVDAAWTMPGYYAISNAYLRDRLQWKTDHLRLAFAPFITESGSNAGWGWNHVNPPNTKGDEWGFRPFPNTMNDVAVAIVQEPDLKIMLGNGYYDMATPFHQTEFDIDHLELPKALQKNIAFKYYPSGHMIYTNHIALKKLYNDLIEFYNIDVSGMAQFDERPEMSELKIAGL